MTRVAFKSLEIATRSGIYKNKNTVVKLQTVMENNFATAPPKKKKTIKQKTYTRLIDHTDDLIFANPPKTFAYMKPLLCSFGTAKKRNTNLM